MSDTKNSNFNKKNDIHVDGNQKRSVAENNPLTRENLLLPVYILNNKILSPLESIVKYLKENKDLTYKEISHLLSRNPKTLAVTYSIASRKHREKIIVDPETYYLDFSEFKSRLSILESVCHALKVYGKKYSQIARMIGKSQKTVWTVCNRAEKKLMQNQEQNSKTEENR